MTQPERVLFVHAHPDDETIATGGTLATLVDSGAVVTLVTCTRGERGEVIPADLQDALASQEALAALREAELRKAVGILGVTDHRFLGEENARWSVTLCPVQYLSTIVAALWGARVNLAAAFTAFFTWETSLIAYVPIGTLPGRLPHTLGGMN